ncbi:AAA family ATPase [Flavobacteriales bacterium]|nr:AAA family ATPase [Flavobacteriales bacterium]
MENLTDILKHLDVNPTPEQKEALELTQKFVAKETKHDFMIIQGSAGTGKSTIIKAIAEYLNNTEINCVLAAPTGKAAKVMKSKSGRIAKTVHSLIYIPEKQKNGLGIKWVRKSHKTDDYSIFIIDESSMISDTINNSEEFIATKPLLTDLIEFVKEKNSENKIIFIGDKYQLPPVKEEESPALSFNYLTNTKKLKGTIVELTKVMRQNENSSILNNATQIRHAISNGTLVPNLAINKISTQDKAVQLLIDNYNFNDPSKVTAIAWINKNVNELNSKVREGLGFSNQKIKINESLMLMKNIYTNNHVIMSGELVKIIDIDQEIEDYADLKFQNAKIEFNNSNGDKVYATIKILTDTLSSLKGHISSEQEGKLLQESYKKNLTFRETQNPSDDEYVGALRPRYSYAVTCHKAQGGEWENVIIHPYIPTKNLRWLYTAITRASEEIYTFNNFR